MNEGTAIEIAKYKMRELGVGKKYLLRYRHFQLDPKESREIRAENHLFILICEKGEIKISSKAGIYNPLDEGINEHQHVHRGLIRIENLDNKTLSVRFIQVIPRLKEIKTKE